ncbi:MAG: hypothetical protein AAGB46_10680 [Verrucomicrobiota bacterium]
MSTFEEIFSEEISSLERAISDIPSEQQHIGRCISLAEIVEWGISNTQNELGVLLGDRGCRLFDQITGRIAATSEKQEADELRDCKRFLRWLMIVHDIGKYDREALEYNGSGHEERSGDYVFAKIDALRESLRWRKENAELFVHLTRFHSQLGIARLGEVSNVFLEPILEALLAMDSSRKRLLLDYLIVMTCCDAGASGNFGTKTFFLDESRVALYGQVSDELFSVAERFQSQERAAALRALLEQAASDENTVVRIKRMITSDNRMNASDSDVEFALRSVASRGLFNPKRFALTQFDHGAYVFAPLLWRLCGWADRVSYDVLLKFILFLGLLCSESRTKKIIQFRGCFSMKADLMAANGERFQALCESVESGDPHKIAQVLKRTDM